MSLVAEIYTRFANTHASIRARVRKSLETYVTRIDTFR